MKRESGYWAENLKNLLFVYILRSQIQSTHNKIIFFFFQMLLTIKNHVCALCVTISYVYIWMYDVWLILRKSLSWNFWGSQQGQNIFLKFKHSFCSASHFVYKSVGPVVSQKPSQFSDRFPFGHNVIT